jgi:hypothetical protein
MRLTCRGWCCIQPQPCAVHAAACQTCTLPVEAGNRVVHVSVDTVYDDIELHCWWVAETALMVVVRVSLNPQY